MTNYLKLFKNNAEYEAYTASTEYSEIPQVSHSILDIDVYYKEPPCNIITYIATAKLPETTLNEGGGLHKNAFNTTVESHTFENSIGTIKFSNNVSHIGNYAFNLSNTIKNIYIPNCVVSFGRNAFYMCSAIDSIDIPSGVKQIDDYAFCFCNHLTSITIEATTPPTLGIGVFMSTNNCPIYVPSGSVDTYKAANNWSTYASRIQAIP